MVNPELELSIVPQLASSFIMLWYLMQSCMNIHWQKLWCHMYCLWGHHNHSFPLLYICIFSFLVICCCKASTIDIKIDFNNIWKPYIFFCHKIWSYQLVSSLQLHHVLVTLVRMEPPVWQQKIIALTDVYVRVHSSSAPGVKLVRSCK